MGRQIMLPYSEIRIANCFRGVELSTEDIAEMQRRIIAENKEWKRRKKRQEDAGSSDEKEAERQKKYSRRRRKASWGAPIAAGVLNWD